MFFKELWFVMKVNWYFFRNWWPVWLGTISVVLLAVIIWNVWRSREITKVERTER